MKNPLKEFHYEKITDRWNRTLSISTNGNGVYLTTDSDILVYKGFKTIYGIGNQQNVYYSNNKETILSLVGKCGKTETRPACFTLATTPNGTEYAKFDHYID